MLNLHWIMASTVSVAIVSMFILQILFITEVSGFTGHQKLIKLNHEVYEKGTKPRDVTNGTADVTRIKRDVRGKQHVPCPTNCTSRLYPLYSELRLNCRKRLTNVKSLPDEINAYLPSVAQNFTKLTIRNTPLTAVPESICWLKQLTHLHMMYNEYLTLLPNNCFTRLRQLRTFDASFNALKSLQDGLFDNLTELQKVYLNWNQITSIGPHLFDDTANLPNLRVIHLEWNDLQEIDVWPLQRAQLINGSSVFLYNNHISRFTNSLEWQHNCTRFGSPSPNAIDLLFNNITHLENLLRGWNLLNDYLNRSCYSLTSGSLLQLKYNPLTCDCKDYDIISISRLDSITYRHWLYGLECRLPSQLSGHKLENVPLEKFVCPVTKNCPPNCTCTKRPYDWSFLVTCPPGSLDHLPAYLPDPDYPPPRVGQFQLHFSGNNITKLVFRSYLTKTKWIDLSKSKVELIPTRVWQVFSRMDHVDLSGNQLTTIPKDLGSNNTKFRWLALQLNPLRCDCEDQWLRGWLHLQSLDKGLSAHVACGSPEWLKGKHILDVTEREFCTNPIYERIWLIVEATVPVFVGTVIVVIAISLLVYRCRVNVFAKFNFHPFNVDECNGEDMSFDAFVCCAGQDDQVAQMIVHDLEQTKRNDVGYKVCYHERDFLLGCRITDSIESAIEHSKRVICLMTNDFVKSPMCMLEFLAAWNLNIERRKHRLIVIKWPDLDLDSDLDPDNIKVRNSVRLFLKTYTYIEHDKDGWWQQVLYAMPINRLASCREEAEPERSVEPDIQLELGLLDSQ